MLRVPLPVRSGGANCKAAAFESVGNQSKAAGGRRELIKRPESIGRHGGELIKWRPDGGQSADMGPMLMYANVARPASLAGQLGALPVAAH